LYYESKKVKVILVYPLPQVILAGTKKHNTYTISNKTLVRLEVPTTVTMNSSIAFDKFTDISEQSTVSIFSIEESAQQARTVLLATANI
jgi:hypothetical protein